MGRGTGYVLAGDIGGTRARFSLFNRDADRVAFESFLPSRDFSTFERALARFFEEARQQVGNLHVLAATFGIAGPVVSGRVRTTNLPWHVDERTIARKFEIPKVTLLNDLVSLGLGAFEVPSRKVRVVHGQRPRRTGGNIAVIAAGTGLGEAIFVWDGARHVPCATEGAHVDFAPRTAVEDELLAALRKDHSHVSYERVVSGSTISALYQFFVARGVRESKASRRAVEEAADPNIAVVDLADAGKSEAAARAIELWCSAYGAEAGNLALKCLATGVYVCGGVSAHLYRFLTGERRLRGVRQGRSPFVEAFLDKGRMRKVLEPVGVAVVAEPGAGLLGAARHAARAAAAL